MKRKYAAVKTKINQKYYLIPRTELIEISESLEYLRTAVKFLLSDRSAEDIIDDQPLLESDGTKADQATNNPISPF